MIRVLLFVLYINMVNFSLCLSQPSGKAAEIFNFINEARENPLSFITKYKNTINNYQPKFISVLEKATPISKVIWDENLAINCKQRVGGELNPSYNGVNKMCGNSSGNGSGNFESDALYFVCVFYTNIMNEDNNYFGFYIDSKGYSFSWGKSCEMKQIKYESTEFIDNSAVDFIKINTAINEVGINEMDKEMIKEINYVRQYPKEYSKLISEYLDNQSKSWQGLSKEEYEAGIELIEELKILNPLQLLFPKRCVYISAKKHGEDCNNRGFTDHTGSDGSSPFSRISSFCTNLTGSENIVGGIKNVRVLVIQLLIDSGISSRGHRYNILNPNWKYVGCYGFQGIDMYYFIQNFATD